MEQPHIVFVCDSNSGRSIAAEYIARKYYPRTRFSSAGTKLKYDKPKPDCVKALLEFANIDASLEKCKLWTDIQGPIDVIVVLCCEPDGSCKRLDPPPPPQTRLLHLPLDGLSEISATNLQDANRVFIEMIDEAVREGLPRLLPDLLRADTARVY